MCRVRDVPYVQRFSCSFTYEIRNYYQLNIVTRTINGYCPLDDFFFVRNKNICVPEGCPEFLQHTNLDLASEHKRVRLDGFQKPVPRSTGDRRVPEVAL